MLPPVPTDERLSFAVDQFTGSGHRHKSVTAAIELNPHSLNVFGNQPLVSVLIDCGTDSYILQLPTDLQAYLHRKLSQKLTTENAR